MFMFMNRRKMVLSDPFPSFTDSFFINLGLKNTYPFTLLANVLIKYNLFHF